MASKYILQPDGSILNLDTGNPATTDGVARAIAKENSGESYKKDQVDKVDLNTNTQSIGSLVNTLAVGENLNTADSKTLEPNLLHFTEQNKSFCSGPD